MRVTWRIDCEGLPLWRQRFGAAITAICESVVACVWWVLGAKVTRDE